MRHPDFSVLDALIVQALALRPYRLAEILALLPVRESARLVARRRAGVSPSGCIDATINERLQALRRAGHIDYDSATSRWERRGTEPESPAIG